jgi:protein-disulfide isomerase
MRLLRRCIFVACVAVLCAALSTAGRAQSLRDQIEDIVRDYIATHPDEVGRIAKQYLVQHPEVFQEILAEMLKKRVAAANANGNAATAANDSTDKSALVKSNAALIFGSARQVTLGNSDGDVTLVEFFDYNCGFCKRALPDMVGLMKSDPKLRVVLKEFPILSAGSVEAAHVAVAVRMQDTDGTKYLDFHQRLLGGHGPANKASALAAAQQAGLDVTRLEKDMDSDEVKATLDEDMTLARTLGLNGTPSYVIGNNVVIGAVGVAALDDKVKLARQQTVSEK